MLNMEQNSKFILWNKNRKMDFSSTRMKEVHSLPFLSSFYLTSAPDIPPWAWREKVKLWIALAITYIFLLCSVLLTPSVFLVLLLQHKSWAPDPPASTFILPDPSLVSYYLFLARKFSMFLSKACRPLLKCSAGAEKFNLEPWVKHYIT